MELLAQVSADMPWLWISARTLGIAAWLASSITVALGLVVASRVRKYRRGPASIATVHRSAATLTLLFAGGHVLLLIPDPYAQLSLLDAFVPGLAPNQTLATGLGTVALLALLLVAIAGPLRPRIGARTWRAIHALAFIVWPLATIHYVVMGSDAMASWSIALVAAIALLLLVLLLIRGYGSVPNRLPVDPTRQMPKVDLVVSQVIAETRDTTTLVLRPESGGAPPSYQPGQFLTLLIPSELTGMERRCYSLSSAPGIDPNLRITVKRQPNGFASNWICDNAVTGLRLSAQPPSGRFTVPVGATDLALFAAGSGITPVFSILKHAIAQRSGRVTLFYANRDEESIIFKNELEALQLAHPQTLQVEHWLETRQGIPQISTVNDRLLDRQGAEVFVCGPGPFMELVRNSADSLGWLPERFHSEEFRSIGSTQSGFESAKRERLSGSQGSGATTRTLESTRVSALSVEVNGQTHAVSWPREQSLVEVVVNEGVDAPYSCLAGICRTCECEVTSGSVEDDTREFTVGSRVLSCQVRPTSNEVSIRY
ncbi:MAG: ferredoxin--NADP reductase [Actinobacteria bacterium]|nr:ferredoxin--NADP reductase [Actinomycetota bacterium]